MAKNNLVFSHDGSGLCEERPPVFELTALALRSHLHRLCLARSTANTLPSPCVPTLTVFVPCVSTLKSTGVSPFTAIFLCVPLPSQPGHSLCTCVSAASAAKTLPLPCVPPLSTNLSAFHRPLTHRRFSDRMGVSPLSTVALHPDSTGSFLIQVRAKGGLCCSACLH